MSRSVRRKARAVWMVGAAILAAAGASAAESGPAGEPFAIESTALVPLDAESALSVVGIHGVILISTREERELRVVSRAPGQDGAERPVGIWQVGSKLIVAPAPGDDGGASQLNVEVPKGFAIAVSADDSDVAIQSEGSAIELRGKNLRASAQSVGGAVVGQLEGGRLSVSRSGDATVRVRGTETTISGMTGSVNVNAARGTITLTGIEGSVELESDASKLVLDRVSGAVRIKAQNGDAKVTGLKLGGELAMVGTPLHLKDGQGDITVISDAPVDFQGMAAALHFDMYGGTLRGKGNDGILEVRTRNTEVDVEAIQDGMRIQGDGLTARIVDVGGELYIDTTISDVVVDRAGSVVLKIDRGSVTIKQAGGPVQATVVGGDVHILDGSAPVVLDLDGGDGEVSWASMSGDKDSQLINKSGSLTVRFPDSGACRIEAKSKYGRIVSDLPTVKVMDDQTEAQGPVNGGYRPIVRIVANGDVHLQSAAQAP